MLGLGSYESSGDEEDREISSSADSKRIANATDTHEEFTPNNDTRNGINAVDDPPLAVGHAKDLEQEATPRPIMGPTCPPPSTAPLNGATSRSQSPYSSTRALLQDLTLPTYPNLDIPPSPPGSPLPGANEKFAHFFELKKQGMHFNDKLAKSSALKNPSLLHKLMDFVAIAEEDQYASTLPKDIWDPTLFPPYAYKEELAKAQQHSLKRREEETRKPREALDFVPESSSATLSRGGTPITSAARNNWRGSAAERVMAGLNRDRVRSPQVSDTIPHKRRALDQGGSRNHN